MALPGPGVLISAITKISRPGTEVFNCGKGGDAGKTYMIHYAIQSVRKQAGRKIPLNKICMIGDRFDTDIRGANSVGVHGLLVLSGTHQINDYKLFPEDFCFFYAEGVGQIAAIHGF